MNSCLIGQALFTPTELGALSCSQKRKKTASSGQRALSLSMLCQIASQGSNILAGVVDNVLGGLAILLPQITVKVLCARAEIHRGTLNKLHAVLRSGQAVGPCQFTNLFAIARALAAGMVIVPSARTASVTAAGLQPWPPAPTFSAVKDNPQFWHTSLSPS